MEVNSVSTEHVGDPTHVLVELESLVHLPGETVNEETTLSASPTFAGSSLLDGGLHRIFQELDGDLHRYDLTILDVLFDHGTILRPLTVLFSAEKVAR